MTGPGNIQAEPADAARDVRLDPSGFQPSGIPGVGGQKEIDQVQAERAASRTRFPAGLRFRITRSGVLGFAGDWAAELQRQGEGRTGRLLRHHAVVVLVRAASGGHGRPGSPAGTAHEG